METDMHPAAGLPEAASGCSVRRADGDFPGEGEAALRDGIDPGTGGECASKGQSAGRTDFLLSVPGGM